MAGLITEERRGAVALWTLDRAERLNALPDVDDGAAVAAVCAAANADAELRCIVLTGAGRAFSAGGDLKAMRDKRGLFAGSAAEIRDRYRQVVHRIVRSLYGLEVPLVAAVNGPAMGLGLGVAALADLRVASERASFGLPFLRLGLIPGDGGAWIMPRTIGYARTAELLFTAKTIDAKTAERWGLVNRTVAHEHLIDEAMALAGEIAAQPPRVLRLAKALLRQGREASFDQILELSAAVQGLAHLTDDHAEGVAAALEKRPAVFRGA